MVVVVVMGPCISWWIDWLVGIMDGMSNNNNDDDEEG